MQKYLKILFGVLLFSFFSSSLAFAVITKSFNATEDSYVRETSPTTNYGSDVVLISDGVNQDPDNGRYGEVITLVKWDLSTIPAEATITGVSISFGYLDASADRYHFYSQDSAWKEGSVTWDDLNIDSTLLGVIPAFTFGMGTHPLNSAGIALVQGWVDGSISNNGIVVRTSGTNNGITMDSKESKGFIPKLEIQYDADFIIDELLSRIEQLETILAGVSRNGKTLFLEGMNLQIVNGLGTTNGNPDDPTGNLGTVNGLGNIIVGYNEANQVSDKSGSHNVVIGHGHNYSSFGGLVTGKNNNIFGAYSNVSGGSSNTASGFQASISGGSSNTASGSQASISGGFTNVAGGFNTSHSSVSGGSHNTASGTTSSVSGGENRTASGSNDWVAGSLFEDF